MNKFIVYFRELFFHGRIDAEINDYGEIESFELSGNGSSFKYSKSGKRKKLNKYNRTGVHTLGTTYPDPYDREELLKQEYKNSNWYSSKVAVIFFTLSAIIIDFCCYVNLFELAAGNSGEIGFMEMLAAFGAAAAIDLLPIFFSHNLHRNSLMKRLEKNGYGNVYKFKFEKQVLTIFTIFNAILFVSIVVLMSITRLFELNPDEKQFWINLIISLIPLATSMVCFILGYLSYNPAKKKLKELNIIKLFLQENINESLAMIEEVKSQPDYYESLKKQDELLYNSAFEFIEKIGECYKSYARMKVIPYLNSPADTTDLSAKRTKTIYQKIKFPLDFDKFYADKYVENNSAPKDSDDSKD